MGKEIAVIKKCLTDSGAILRKYFRKVDYKLKGRANLLTKADLASQKAVLKTITSAFPDHDYLAEEDSRKLTGSRWLWIVDPLDGTTNYAHGYPASCISIGLVKDGKPFAGGVYDPFRDELFLVQKGRGATLNGKKISVSGTKKLSESLLYTGFGYDRAERAEFYCSFYIDFIKICHDVRRSGSAALDMAWVACGRVDGMWEFKLNPWDVTAGLLLVSEAGGKVSDFSGKPWDDPLKFGFETLAANGKIDREMLRVIGKRVAAWKQAA